MKKNRRVREIICLGIGLSLLTYAWAAEPSHTRALKKLSLSDAVWLSLRYNPNIQSEAINRVVQKFGVEVAKNQFELQYALTGSATQNYNKASGASSTTSSTVLTPGVSLNLPTGANIALSSANTLNGRSTGGTYNPALTATLTQPLMRGFGQAITLSTLANAYDAERINQLTLSQTIIATIVKVAGDFFTVIQNQQNVTTQNMALENVRQRIAQDQIKIKAGKMAPNDDRLQAQADLAQAELATTSADNTLLQSKLALLADIGLSPDEPIEIDPTLTMPAFNLPTMSEAKKNTLASDPNYQTSLINQRIDQRALVVAKDNDRAQLNLTVTGTTGGGSGNGPNSGVESLANGSAQNSSVGLNLTVPIDNMQNQQAILTAKAKLKTDEINLRTSAWALETNAINAMNNLITLKQQLDLAKQAVDTQAEILSLTELKRNYGLASALDVTLQQNSLTTTRLNYTSTQITYLNTWFQFRQMLGKTLEDWHVQVRY